MTALRIYTAQVNPTVGDISGNKTLILEHYKKSLAENADICVLPEAVLCGYSPQDLLLRPQFIHDIKEAALTIVKEVTDTALFLSVPWFDDTNGQLYNAVLFIHEQEIKQIIYKQCLPNFSVMDEKRVFSEGINNKIIPFKGVNIGLLVCHDTWWPEVSRNLKKAGADILISLNASPYEIDKEHFRTEFCKARVKETGLFFYTSTLSAGKMRFFLMGALSQLTLAKSRVILSLHGKKRHVFLK